MIKEFLTKEHPNAFLDWPMKKPAPHRTKKCPVCTGYGGWNLETFAYSLPRGMEDNQHTRHTFRHFRSMCPHCYGYGWIPEEENCIGHEWNWKKNTGKCLNLYYCVNCNKTQEVDSGD